MHYAIIKNGEVVREIQHGRPWKNISFCQSSTEAEYIAAGLLPIVENKPVPSGEEVVRGFTYTINPRSVDKTWSVERRSQPKIVELYLEMREEKKYLLAQKVLVDVLVGINPAFATSIDSMDALPDDENLGRALQSIIDQH